jgi:hypothetical protein
VNVSERIDRHKRAKLIYKYALVNGDDILFKGPSSLIKIFKDVSSQVGFKVSQGKNYISPDTCLINSQLYIRKGGKMTREGYLNLRLIKGNNIKARVAGGEKSVTPEQIGGELSKMARLCTWSRSAIPTAFKRWAKDWKGCYFTPNWYLPVHLGGYGLDINIAPVDWKVTRAQREIAARFVADPTLALYRMKGGNLLTKNYFGALLNPVMIPGDCA